MIGHFVKWPPLESVQCLIFVGIMCLQILYSLSVGPSPENVYLDKNISILGGLEAEILTNRVA